MSTQPETHARNSLAQGWEHLAARERRIVESVLHHKPVARDINHQYLEERTFGQRLADRIAAFGGSWPFILLFLGFLIAWMTLNTLLLARPQAFDPYPYILLNLILSSLAALQAPVIMMSQNRQAAKDRLDAAHDYEVNLKAELEVIGLHEKLDNFRDEQWGELIRLQQEQIQLLTRLLSERQTSPKN